MSRRAALLAALVATVGLFVVLAGLDGTMQDAGGAGIVDFELAGSDEEARSILDAWGTRGKDAARTSLWLDFGFLVAYGAFGALLALVLRDAAPAGPLRSAGRAAVAAPPLAAACDVVENVLLLLVLGGTGGSGAPVAAEVFARAKFTLLLAGLAYAVLVGLALAVRALRR